MQLESLPIDNLHTICHFLYGFDLFRFSHTNSWALRVLSNNSFWRKRVSSGTEFNASLPQRIWKQRYLQSRSLQFVDPNLLRRLQRRDSQLAYALLERPDLPVFWAGNQFQLRNENHESFSLDVWFCLFSGTSKQPPGGTIYSLQGGKISKPWPTESFVLVDVTRTLFCSVINEKKAVARDLESYRWYHVALTYDVEKQRQDVYVDGSNVWSVVSGLHSNLDQFCHEQIGTGFWGHTLATGNANSPIIRANDGWYSFNGLIDQFRVWRSSLPSYTIAELARGGQPNDLPILATIKPSHGRRNLWIHTKSVRCTRPSEENTLKSSSQDHDKERLYSMYVLGRHQVCF